MPGSGCGVTIVVGRDTLTAWRHTPMSSYPLRICKASRTSAQDAACDYLLRRYPGADIELEAGIVAPHIGAVTDLDARRSIPRGVR